MNNTVEIASTIQSALEDSDLESERIDSDTIRLFGPDDMPYDIRITRGMLPPTLDSADLADELFTLIEKSSRFEEHLERNSNYLFLTDALTGQRWEVKVKEMR